MINMIEDYDRYTMVITIDISCFGYLDEEGEIQFAHGHVPYRRIRVQDQSKISRCRACQAEHRRVYNRILIKDKREDEE